MNPRVKIYRSRAEAGAAAADHVQEAVNGTVGRAGRCRLMFGCAPSQDDFLEALIQRARRSPDVWTRVETFHMDEYVGISAAAPQSFRHYLREHFLQHVAVKSFEPLNGDAENAEKEAERYDALLAEQLDIICMGIGENGHIAFNDPPVADFSDQRRVKVVKLDSVCRQQQVNDGCFPKLALVPKHALTVTVPVFARARLLSCVVPTVRKAAAVNQALTGAVGAHCPASLLQTHSNASVWLDGEAASMLKK